MWLEWCNPAPIKTVRDLTVFYNKMYHGFTVLETPHVIVASAIAYKIGNPYLAIPLSFASHFVLETVPHWNPHIMTEMKKFGEVTRKSKMIILADVILAFISGFYLASKVLPDINHFWLMIFASFFGVLPDLMEAPYFFLKMRNKFLEWWIKGQKALQSDTGPVTGILTQAVTICAALLWIK
jgi:hypothetical protein